MTRTVEGFLEDRSDETLQPDKLCPACKRCLFYEDFDTNEYASDGYYTYCKTCRAAKKKDREDPPPEIETVEHRPVSPTVPKNPVPAGIMKGIRVPLEVETPMEGVWSWYTAKGWRVVAIHHSADPDKRPGTIVGDAWISKKKKDMSARDWAREMDLDHTISEGDPFYGTFNRALHVRRCEYDPTRPLCRAWDFGRAHPAIVFFQLDEKMKVRVLWSEIYTNLTIYQLVPIVFGETATRFPGATVRDYGDPAGAQETDKGATTQILLDTFKIKLIYRFSFIEEGTKMIDKKLLIENDGVPGILIDHSNKEMIDGFESGYVIDVGASGKDQEGRAKNSPKKDGWYEHVMDALRYGFINVFTMFSGKEEEKDKAWEKVGLWRTNEQHAQREADNDPIGEFNS